MVVSEGAHNHLCTAVALVNHSNYLWNITYPSGRRAFRLPWSILAGVFCRDRALLGHYSCSDLLVLIMVGGRLMCLLLRQSWKRFCA
jgi:hypothetical protein